MTSSVNNRILLNPIHFQIAFLGPTFIKVGQALSIRPDLASPAYLEELVKLQDQVPPFSSVEALKIIGDSFSKLSVCLFGCLCACFTIDVYCCHHSGS